MKLTDDMFFAHPVLWSVATDYTDGSFESEFSVGLSDLSVAVEWSHRLDCDALNRLLETGQAGCGFYLINKRTYLNQLIETGLGQGVYTHNANDLFGTVAVRPVIWSKKPVEAWASNQLHAEYSQPTRLPVSALLAIGDEHRFTIDRERLKPFESIFTLTAFESLEPGEIAVDPEGDKISIKVHPTTKASIEGIRNSDLGRTLLLNAVYLPAVMQVLTEVSRDPALHETRAWFRVFEAKCASANIDLSRLEALRDAQRLLAKPFARIERNRERLFS